MTDKEAIALDRIAAAIGAAYFVRKKVDGVDKAEATHDSDYEALKYIEKRLAEPPDHRFIRHIQAHLKPGEEVICKICGKTVREIDAEAEPPAPTDPERKEMLYYFDLWMEDDERAAQSEYATKVEKSSIGKIASKGPSVFEAPTPNLTLGPNQAKEKIRALILAAPKKVSRERVKYWIPCTCDVAYTGRGLSAPDCPFHAFTGWEDLLNELGIEVEP